MLPRGPTGATRKSSGDDADYLAFEDETGRLDRLAVGSPSSPLPLMHDAVSANALARGLLPRQAILDDDPEPPAHVDDFDDFDDKTTKKKPGKVDVADRFDDQSAATIARPLDSIPSPTPLPAPPISSSCRDVGEAAIAPDPEARIAAPVRKCETARPRLSEAKPEVKETTKIIALPAASRHPTTPPPALMTPPSQAHPLLPLPPIDSTPPPVVAIATPMVMHVAMPTAPGNIQGPLPYPPIAMPAGAHSGPALLPRLAMLAAGALVIAASVFFLLRPRIDATIAFGGPVDPTPVPMEPVELAPPASPATPSTGTIVEPTPAPGAVTPSARGDAPPAPKKKTRPAAVRAPSVPAANIPARRED